MNVETATFSSFADMSVVLASDHGDGRGGRKVPGLQNTIRQEQGCGSFASIARRVGFKDSTTPY